MMAKLAYSFQLRQFV